MNEIKEYYDDEELDVHEMYLEFEQIFQEYQKQHPVEEHRLKPLLYRKVKQLSLKVE